MTSLMEQPLIIVGVGAAILLVLFGVLQQTGKHFVLYAMIGVALLTVLLLALERMTITPSEAVRKTIYDVAAAASRNDADAVAKLISRRDPQMKAQAKAHMAPFQFQDVSVKQIDNLAVRPKGDPPSASAEVQILAIGGERLTNTQHRVPRRFKVNFVLEDDAWRVRSYEDLGDGLRQ